MQPAISQGMFWTKKKCLDSDNFNLDIMLILTHDFTISDTAYFRSWKLAFLLISVYKKHEISRIQRTFHNKELHYLWSTWIARVCKLMNGVNKWENKAHMQNFWQEIAWNTHKWKNLEEIWRKYNTKGKS